MKSLRQQNNKHSVAERVRFHVGDSTLSQSSRHPSSPGALCCPAKDTHINTVSTLHNRCLTYMFCLQGSKRFLSTAYSRPCFNYKQLIIAFQTFSYSTQTKDNMAPSRSPSPALVKASEIIKFTDSPHRDSNGRSNKTNQNQRYKAGNNNSNGNGNGLQPRDEPPVERSFLNHNSYPDTNTDTYKKMEEYLESTDSETENATESDVDDNDEEDDFGKEKKKLIESEENGEEVEEDDGTKTNIEDIFDLDQSRSPDPTTFDSLDSQLKYEIEKCIKNLQPQYRSLSNTESAKKTTGSSKEFTANGKLKTQVLNEKSREPNYEYLSVQDTIELVNKREYTLVSIDNEFFERSMSKVIEVGLSIYNPKYQKFALFPQFFHIHFIIKEFINLRNGAFVPDSKMNNITGQSIVISKHDIPKAMSLVFEILGPNVYVVGHNVSGDISSFKYLNYQIPSNIKVIDTVKLWYSFVGRSSGKSSLTYILDKLGIPNSFLHNGVNDAYYTLVVCLMLTSPELINNLTFKKKVLKPSKCIESTDSLSSGESTPSATAKKQPPDFSDLDPDLAEIKLKRWQRKQKKAEEKSKKKTTDKYSDNSNVHIRCSIDPAAIATKMRSGPSKKNGTKNPPVNKFFKPTVYDEDSLVRKLKELDV